MALRKCPKCELNYLRGEETLCHVCASSKSKKEAVEEEVVLCSNCGEFPAEKGSDLCKECLAEQKRVEELENQADSVRNGEVEIPLEVDITQEDKEM